MINPFNFSATPNLHFGVGKISFLHTLIKPFGKKVLLVTGARSFTTSAIGIRVLNELQSSGFSIEIYPVDKEPTPELIDTAVQKYQSNLPDMVIAIGGGSALDAGKAISAMLPLNEPVKDYLEGVGSKPAHPGVKVTFIAIPTTAGTGSEATKNAVISEVGLNGYKRSLRHNNFVPNIAIIDPALTLSCPPATTAASGMDSFTQLLESYVSTTANPLTDAYALEGLRLISTSLLQAYHHGDDLDARANMSLAAYLSGVTLANAGLGLVHGFASSVGGYFEISHGVICSALMAPANKITVRKLRMQKENATALTKYANAGKLFARTENKSDDYYVDALLALLDSWTSELKISRLNQFNISPLDQGKIVKITDNKNNPVVLSKEEISEVLSMAC